MTCVNIQMIISLDGATDEYGDEYSTEELTGLTQVQYYAQKNKMLKSVFTYGGFYVGRYEAGVPANQTVIDGTSSSSSNKLGIPVVQKGATVWTSISYVNVNTNAKSIHDTTSVKSGLITGTQWDTVCAWIERSGISITNTLTWGNHKNSESPANVEGAGEKQVTGFSEFWKANNIYDLAGNNWEYVGEKNASDSSYCVSRGCGNGYNIPVTYRNNSSLTPNLGITFRIVLYIM